MEAIMRDYLHRYMMMGGLTMSLLIVAAITLS